MVTSSGEQKDQLPEDTFREQQTKIAKDMHFQVDSCNQLIDTLNMYARKGKLPSGYTFVKHPRVALIKMVSSDLGYSLEASVEFKPDLTFNMYHRGIKVENEVVKHIVKSKKIKLVSEAFDIANFLCLKA